MKRLLLLLAFTGLTSACAEAVTRTDGGDFDGLGSDGDGRGDDGGPDAQGPLTINEIRAAGDDWVELYNRGSSEISMAGYRLTDSDDLGQPRLDRAVVFPANATIAAGGFFFVLADVTAEPDLQTDCLDPEIPVCMHAGWFISKDDGDRLHLFDAEGLPVAIADYPPGTVPDDKTWCRLADGDGNFEICTPTPAAPNSPE